MPLVSGKTQYAGSDEGVCVMDVFDLEEKLVKPQI